MKYFKEIKCFKDLLAKAKPYLEPKRASMMELFVTIFKGLLAIKAPSLMLDWVTYRPFQSEAKVEQIIAIVTTRSVSY